MVKKQKQLGVFKDMNRNQVMAIKKYAYQTIMPREWAQGVANAGIESVVISQISDADDAVIFTDDSVKRGVKSGWAFSVRIDGQTVAEDSCAVEIIVSRMSMENKVVTEALLYLKKPTQESSQRDR